MDRQAQQRLRQRLVRKKRYLAARLERIRSNVQRGLDPDSAERAKQLEDSDVVDTLGKEALLELERIDAMLRRMDDGRFGVCARCGGPIEGARLQSYPYATECMGCLREAEARTPLS